MRSIKFRAWCPERKMIAEVVCINFREGTVTVVFADGHGFTDKIGSVVLLQYTGLHDKNGKEIYEGDIVNIPTANDGYKRSQIVWSDGAWVLGSWNGKILQRWVISQFEMEVIGNIYENPELITLKEDTN